MNVVVVPDEHWSYGTSDTYFDASTYTVFVKQTNNVIASEVPVESIPIEDESELYNFTKPPEFSLEAYAKNMIVDEPIVYTPKESVDKIMRIKSVVEEDILNEKIKKQKELQDKLDQEQNKKDFQNNINTLAANLENYIGGFNTF
jgi:hypothetical protein